MHSLEYQLFQLSERIRKETGNDDLAIATMELACESHFYQPPAEKEESRAGD